MAMRDYTFETRHQSGFPYLELFREADGAVHVIADLLQLGDPVFELVKAEARGVERLLKARNLTAVLDLSGGGSVGCDGGLN
jgi:hypothetical protein